MEFVANHWWLWLVIGFVSTFSAAVLMFTGGFSLLKMFASDGEEGKKGAIGSVLGMLFLALVASVSDILFVLSIIMIVVDKLSKG